MASWYLVFLGTSAACFMQIAMTSMIIWYNFAKHKALCAKFIAFIKPPVLHQTAKCHQKCYENREPAECVTIATVMDCVVAADGSLK